MKKKGGAYGTAFFDSASAENERQQRQ